jgi:putative transposase
VLDDFFRYIVAWKLCTTMSADDVTDTLGLALELSCPEKPDDRHTHKADIPRGTG